MTDNFDELFDDVSPEERARLRAAHDLLLAAGPMPELPPELEEPVAPTADIIEYPTYPKRRYVAGAIAAAAVVAVTFGAGYLFGHRDTGSFVAAKTVRMHATPAAPEALASIKLGKHDDAGNWPMLVTVSNLPKLPPGGYYTLWLTRKGKAVAPCGSFHAEGNTSSMTFTVAYSLKRFDGWVVTKTMPGHHATNAEPGTSVLTT
jgi:hypothetical protein